MLTSVSVVVILGAIIATIARAVLADDGQPATPDLQAGTGPTRADDADGGPTPSAERGEGPAEDAALDVTTAPGSALGEQAAALLAALAPEPGEETILVPAADVRTAGRPSSGATGPSWWQRVRAVTLLALMIAGLGAVAAAALALLVVGGAAFFDQALG